MQFLTKKNKLMVIKSRFLAFNSINMKEKLRKNQYSAILTSILCQFLKYTGNIETYFIYNASKYKYCC